MTDAGAVMPAQVDAAEVAAFHERNPRPDSRRRWQYALVAEIAAILIFWEIAVGQLGLIRANFFPPPSAIATSLFEIAARDSFLNHLSFSLSNLLIGVALATVIGVPVGLAAGWSRMMEVTVAPLLWTLYAVPKVAFAPLLILALGLGHPSKIALVFLLGVFPIALNTMEGVRTVDPSLIRAARVFGTSEREIARKVILPATLPFVLVGIRRAIGLGFIGAMLGEFLGGAKGIGHLLNRATHEFHMDQALALVVIMVVVANIGLWLLSVAQRRWAPWAE